MRKISLQDIKFMNLAIRLGEKAKGRTLPNPAVGAVLVKDGKVISSGYHEGSGKPHAESTVLEKAGKLAEGGTLYVTLEPCNHYGKTPPCTHKILKSRIKEVVFGIKDPNPASLEGAKFLKSKGVKVVEGVLKRRCFELIDDFYFLLKTKRPFVSLKLASSLNGFIYARERRSITCEESLKLAHKIRSQHQAVMVGIKTVLVDDPLLNVRKVKTFSQPKAVVLDTNLKIPESSRLVKERGEELFVFCKKDLEDSDKARRLKEKGVRVIGVETEDGKVCLESVFEKLKSFGILSVLCEGGAELGGKLLEKGLVSKIYLFYAPFFFKDGTKMVKISKLLEGWKVWRYSKTGRDFLVVLYPEKLLPNFKS